MGTTSRAFILRKVDILFWIGNAAMDLFVVLTIVLFFYNHHSAQQGNQLFEKRLYSQALTQYQRIYGNRFLQFGYNMEAASAQIDAAKCYCQLGNFEEARKLYLLIVEQYTDTYKRIAERRLRELDEGLKFVAEFNPDAITENPMKDLLYSPGLAPSTKEALMATGVEDIGTLDSFLELARTYQFKLFCDKKALGVYVEVMEKAKSSSYKELAKERIDELKKSGVSLNEQ